MLMPRTDSRLQICARYHTPCCSYDSQTSGNCGRGRCEDGQVRAERSRWEREKLWLVWSLCYIVTLSSFFWTIYSDYIVTVAHGPRQAEFGHIPVYRLPKYVGWVDLSFNGVLSLLIHYCDSCLVLYL